MKKILSGGLAIAVIITTMININFNRRVQDLATLRDKAIINGADFRAMTLTYDLHRLENMWIIINIFLVFILVIGTTITIMVWIRET